MQEWQVENTKNSLMDILKRMREEGPQIVTEEGRPIAVLLSTEAFGKLKSTDFRELEAHRKPFKEYLLEGPKWPDDLIRALENRSSDRDGSDAS